MDELLDYYQTLLEYAQNSGGNLNIASQQALAQFIQQFGVFIEEYSSRDSKDDSDGDITLSSDAQLLWILSGQQPQAFISYLRTYPTEATQELLRNPTLLSRTIDSLSRQMPQGEQPVIDGIPHADLQSSNVWGAAYDKKTGKMRVRFQGGSEYEYDGVPANIFNAFIHGNASAKTKGKNQYGEWWPSKNPSLGAAMNQYIKAGNFPYRKVA